MMGAFEVVFAYKGNKTSVWITHATKFKNFLDILKKKLMMPIEIKIRMLYMKK